MSHLILLLLQRREGEVMTCFIPTSLLIRAGSLGVRRIDVA
jgi:hypothetical protein